MDRKDLFRRFVEVCSNENQWIGQGNPLADILIIGREPAIQAADNDDLTEIKKNISWNQNGLETGKYHIIQVKRTDCKGGHTWLKYQKLTDYVYNDGEIKNNEFLNFEYKVFTSEANNTVSIRTYNAKNALEKRKKMFKKSECDFIRSFPVTILACGDYYTNNDKVREIDSIFDVKFDSDGEIVVYSQKGKPYKFWVHHNSDRTRILIHTRQLSTDIPDIYLNAIAEEIKIHLMNIINQ